MEERERAEEGGAETHTHTYARVRGTKPAFKLSASIQDQDQACLDSFFSCSCSPTSPAQPSISAPRSASLNYYCRAAVCRHTASSTIERPRIDPLWDEGSLACLPARPPRTRLVSERECLFVSPSQWRAGTRDDGPVEGDVRATDDGRRPRSTELWVGPSYSPPPPPISRRRDHFGLGPGETRERSQGKSQGHGGQRDAGGGPDDRNSYK